MAEVASLVASIIIDKNNVSVQALKAISSAQRDLENNKLEIFFDLSDASLTKELNKVQKKLSTTDYKIKVVADGKEQFAKDLKEFQKIIKDFASGKGINTGIGKSLIDEKQLKSTIELFSNIEKHLSDIKKVISDVGDGNELSPLLTEINKISSAVSELSVATSKIKLNVGIDLGSEVSEKLNQKVLKATARQLEAYRNLFSKMRSTGKTNKEMLQFFEPDEASISELVGQYKSIIERAKSQFPTSINKNGRTIKSNIYKDILGDDYTEALKEIENANRQLSRATAKRSENGILGDLFGDKTDLSGIIDQLNLIVNKLDEISISAKGFTDTFKDGLNVNTSVEEIINLTNKVKELETELANVRNNNLTSPQKTNISLGDVSSQTKVSDIVTDQIVANEKKKQEAYKATADSVVYHAGVLSKLNKAETNGRFYGSNRGTGYFGTGHYFVDSNSKHYLDNSSTYSKLPYSSVDISQYDNLFKANNDTVARNLHEFLKNITRYTQGEAKFNTNELFSQFENVFGNTVMDIKDFESRINRLKDFMTNSSLSDRSDSVSTQFMKSLGYGGVDTRGTKFADTEYGTVIYDLKEESVLQANITDELQKQGQMLEKINYEKGQVFDSSEDSRLQDIINQQEKGKAIREEYNKIYDDTKLNSYSTELSEINKKLDENDEIIGNCRLGIESAEKEAQQFAKEMKELGIEMSNEEIQNSATESKKSYQERIDELEKERPLLEARRQELEANLDVESKLSKAAMERATATVEDQMKDAFPDSSTDIKSETNGMENVEKATDDAAQAKKDFATANKGVQSSIDSSENPLKLEAELMNQIAKSAREAADAKKEFVEANKQVKESSNDSNSNLGGSSEDFKTPKKAKKNKYSKYKKISEDEFFTNSNDYITAANKKLTENDNIILGNSVDAKLITDGLAEGLVQVTAKIKDANGAWKTFSAKVDADGNVFEETLKPIIENINLLEEKLANFDRETSPALTYQETLDKANEIRQKTGLSGEYTINVDSNEFVTITKKISDIDGETKTLTQTFKSAQDAIDNFGKAASNSAEKTKVALKKVEKQKKEVVETDTVATDSDKSDDINYLTKLTKLLNNIKKLRKDNEVLQKDPVKNAPVIKTNNENIEVLRKQYASTLAKAKASGNFDTEAFAREKAEIDSNTEAVLKNAAARRQVAQAQAQAKADQKDVTDTDFIIKQTESLMSKFNAYKATNTKLFASSKPEAQKLVTQFDEMYNRLIMIKEQADRVKNGFADSFDGKSIREARKDVQDLSGEFRNFSNDVKTAGYNSKTLGDTLKITFKNLTQYFVGANALQNIERGFTEIYNAAKEYNESVVNLQIASGENEDYVNSLMKTYNGMAKTLGATTKEVAESADNWLRQGYSLEDTNNLITASMVQSKVGQLDSAESTQYLTSALKGYKLEASDAMNVVDKMSAVDLQAAVSLGGLAEAMAETANSARTMGISMDQLLGYAAVVGETTQDSMSSVGNAFKRIFSRMGNVKAGKFISDDGEDLSDVEKVLKKFNIKLRDSKDEFRNFGDVIDEVASRWNTFTTVEQRAIVTAMAGATQSEKLLVLFENYPNALKYAETAANASGTAMEKFGAYEEGVEAKTKEVKAAFEGLSNSLLDSDAIKVVLEGLTKLIEALDFLVEKVGTLGSIGAIVSGVAGAKGYGLTYSYKSWLQTPYYA